MCKRELVSTNCSDQAQVVLREPVIPKNSTSICHADGTNRHFHASTKARWTVCFKSTSLKPERCTPWPLKRATLGARMASASQPKQPRHGAEGGAWGRDKLFLPWSVRRHGDLTSLEPQLSNTDKIHMSVWVDE